MFRTEKVIVVLILAVLLTIPQTVKAQNSPQLSQEFWNITLTGAEEKPDVQSEQSDGGYVDYLRRRVKEIEAPKGVVSTTLPRRAGFVTYNYANVTLERALGRETKTDSKELIDFGSDIQKLIKRYS